jgi:hypothetical protein
VVTIAFARSRTSDAASVENWPGMSPAQRASMMMFFPST